MPWLKGIILRTQTQGRSTMTRASFRSLSALLLAAGFLLLAAPLQAGPIFVPGQLEGNKFTPAPGVPCHCYTIRFSTATVGVEKHDNCYDTGFSTPTAR